MARREVRFDRLYAVYLNYVAIPEIVPLIFWSL
jgi:hypothetical protein